MVPGVIYANSDLPEKRMKMILSEKEIAELPDNNTDLFKRKMIDLYIDRPSFEIIENLCFAIFLKCKKLIPEAEENDSQLEELNDEIIENNHSFVDQCPRNAVRLTLRCDKMFLTAIKNPMLIAKTLFSCFILLK